MTKETAIKIFEQKHIRSVWKEDEEKWYFSIIDVIEVLTGNVRPRKYWSDLKAKLKREGSELSEKIGQLKLQSTDGKFYNSDVANSEQLFRLIQSNTRREIEEKTGKRVVTKQNAKQLDQWKNKEIDDK